MVLEFIVAFVRLTPSLRSHPQPSSLLSSRNTPTLLFRPESLAMNSFPTSTTPGSQLT